MRISLPVRGTTSYAQRRALLGVIVLILSSSFSGCRKGEEGVTISGDIEGLDTLGLRGAALLQEADNQPRMFDSLKALGEGKTGGPAASVPDDEGANGVVRSTENPMAARARALADSMVQASAQAAANNSTGGSSRDSVRGIVTVIGSDPMRQVVLRSTSGGVTFAMSGMVTSGMSQLEGLELVLRGVLVSPRDIVVSSYVVRAANGVPAFDGILTGENDAWSLQLTDGSGRRRIPVVPSTLREANGRRVWIAVDPNSNAVQSFGLITRR